MKYFEYEVCSEKNRIPLPESYRDCIALAQSDFFRYYGRKVGLFRMLRDSTHLRAFFWMRMASYRKGVFRKPSTMLYNYFCRRRNIHITPDTKIGWGLYLGHGNSLIVNQTAIIGNNCTLSPFTTIGANDGSAAVIGDNVYVAPSVCIVENVHIGNNAAIGAGAVVVRDVSPDTTVAGVPAKKVSDKGHPEYVQRRWEY